MTAMKNIADQIVHSTARIQTVDAAGEEYTATGFFIHFCQKGSRKITALITNRHVVADARAWTFHMTVEGSNGMPIYGKHFPVDLKAGELDWVFHPDGDVDLAALPIAPLTKRARELGTPAFFAGVGMEFLARESDLNELSAVEEILTVGYPRGYWDEHNNMPIARRGVTATAPYLDFEGRKEFAIDCASFRGSSGSPVYLYNIGSYLNKSGTLVLGNRVKLIGVLWGVPRPILQGTVSVQAIPIQRQITTSTPGDQRQLVLPVATTIFAGHMW